MEEQRHLTPAHSRSFHMETLPRQNHSDIARRLDSLDSADGNSLFPAACPPISTFRAGARFWVLLLTYITNRFAGQIEADAPLALATAKIK